MLHTGHQQVVFYTYLNKTLKDPHLSLGIRSILNGAEINVKRSLEFIPEVDLDETHAYELLWAYRKLIPVKNKYVDNALENVHIDQDKKDLWMIKATLNDHLIQLGLPKIRN